MLHCIVLMLLKPQSRGVPEPQRLSFCVCWKREEVNLWMLHDGIDTGATLERMNVLPSNKEEIT